MIVVILKHFQGIEGFKNAKRGTNYAGKVAGEAIAKVIIYCSRFKVLILLIRFSLTLITLNMERASYFCEFRGILLD